MEDKMVVKGEFRGLADEDFFAVFDGHTNAEAAAFASQVTYSCHACLLFLTASVSLQKARDAIIKSR